MSATEWKCKLNGALNKGINDLPHFLLPSQSAPASQLPHLTSSLPSGTTCLPGHSVTIYLFILNFRAKGQRGFLPALNCPPTFLHCDGGSEAAPVDLEMGILAASSLLSAAAVGADRAARGAVAASAASHTLGIRENEQFQLVTGVAALCGWP